MSLHMLILICNMCNIVQKKDANWVVGIRLLSLAKKEILLKFLFWLKIHRQMCVFTLFGVLVVKNMLLKSRIFCR